jgi:hypothetical protein
MKNITFQLQQQSVNVLDKLEDLMFMILFWQLRVMSNIIDACTAKVAPVVLKICVNTLRIGASNPRTVAFGSV